MSTLLIYGYIFLKLREGSDFYGTFRELCSLRNVIKCDAVRGAFDLILLARGEAAEEIGDFAERCAGRQGVQNAVFSPVDKPALADGRAGVISGTEHFPGGKRRAGADTDDSGNGFCRSYVMLEVEAEKLELIYESLCRFDSVEGCDLLKDKRAILLTVKAPLFDRIDELVSKKIARLDGVLRASQYPIIPILEMQAG